MGANDDNHFGILNTELVPIETEDYQLPSIKSPGFILVHVLGPGETGVYRFETKVLDHSESTFWINEGVGFDYWFDEYIDNEFDTPGYYVIEGVRGHWIRGDGYSTDDDEDWEFASVRPATEKEIKIGTVE